MRGMTLRWPVLLLVVVAVLSAAAVIFARVNAAGSSGRGLEAELQRGTPGTKTLIVLVHGYTGGNESMEGVRRAALGGSPAPTFSASNLPRSSFQTLILRR